MLETFLHITRDWFNLFSQERSYHRAMQLSIGMFTSLGRSTISRMLATIGRCQFDWSSNYRIFSKAKWSIPDLFSPILRESLKYTESKYIGIAVDDTHYKKTGKKILGLGWIKDPLGPPFHINLIWGIKCFQASILLPLYNKKVLGGDATKACRGIPIAFSHLPKLKSFRKFFSKERESEYKEFLIKHTSSYIFVQNLRNIRASCDKFGYKAKLIIAVGDGSYCNRRCLTSDIPGTVVLSRTRKDASLYFKDSTSDFRFYDPVKITPEDIRRNDSYRYNQIRVHYGGDWRRMRYKEIKEVYWKRSTKRKPLRLIVLAPIPYRRHKTGRLSYRDAAYLLTTDLETSVGVLIQKYLDRWQIEVNFEEEKRDMGLGQAQVWSKRSISRVPGFLVASYGAMMLSSVILYGDKRYDGDFPLLPKWRKASQRPSCLDIMTRLRYEIAYSPGKFKKFGTFISKDNILFKSAA